MALRAFDLYVFALQRIVGTVVFFHAKQRGLPAFQVVALRAFAFFLPLFELALVRVGFMAITTIGKHHSRLEISIQVTSGAGNLRVFTNKRIFRF